LFNDDELKELNNALAGIGIRKERIPGPVLRPSSVEPPTYESFRTNERTRRSRRAVLRGGLLLGATTWIGPQTACSSPRRASTTPSPTTPVPEPTEGARVSSTATRTLLAYFSRPGENYYYGGRRDLEVGNTEVLARMISELIKCDVYRIEATEPYPRSYDATVEHNVREQDADARPAIVKPLASIEQYDTVLLGSPI
jgi:Flavodoxin